jgi:N-acetylglucosaminyldiphosphoundecaprenol N-acetyl-beta-D-mannosaminyltransferase
MLDFKGISPTCLSNKIVLNFQRISGTILTRNQSSRGYSRESMADLPPRVNVLGVGVHALNLRSAVAAIDGAIMTRSKGYVCVTGVHGVSEAQSNPAFRAILNNAFLNTPDGMPLVWIGRSSGFQEMDRVYGPDLLLEVCRASESEGWRHFFYGGGPGTAADLAATLRSKFPRIQIVGTHTPPFRPLTPSEFEELQAQVAGARPDIIWVGLSTPKQELFMSSTLSSLDVPIMIGIGAAFDLISGKVRQSPRWIQRIGFEWLYRLIQEPRRLWRRYFKNNPLFVWRLFLQKTGLRRYPL